MATITIDGKSYQADASQNLLQTALQLGFDLPYFCWHPAMGSVGACRQCAVRQFRDDDDTTGMIVMACMVPVSDGLRISIDDPEAKEFRKGVVEWLMTNHPHDCAVCDEGGECHLQDMTVMAGHSKRRYRFQKRTHRNQYLGPFINHEMNRCIQCYRCVRFYKDYAGGRDLDVFSSRNRVYFGRHEEGVLENPFSGNLVEVCPTGVFTDKPFKAQPTRKWDLSTAASICPHCSLGCNTIVGERYGKFRRVLNRYHHDLNGYFLCDRGRFGSAFVNSDKRSRQTQWRENGQTVSLDKQTITDLLATEILDGKKVIGIGSPRASMEANYALRTLVGEDAFFNGLSENDAAISKQIISIYQHTHIASLRDAAESDAVFVLGEDLTNTAPRLALALRQAVRNTPLEDADKLKIPRWHARAVADVIQHRHGPLHLASIAATQLDDIATSRHLAAPADLARIGFAIAHELDSDAPAVANLTSEQAAYAKQVAHDLRQAKRPLVVAGSSLGSVALVQAAGQITKALKQNEARISLIVAEANTLGVALLGDKSISSAIQEKADTIIVLENNIFRRSTDHLINRMLKSANCVITIDHLENATTQQAHASLPAATFTEASGTSINNEGRAQRSFQVVLASDPVQASWRWLRDLMVAANKQQTGAWETLDDVLASLVTEFPKLAKLSEVAPNSKWRQSSQKVARASRRSGGRTAILATVHEPKPPSDPDAPLSFTMEGNPASSSTALNNRYWSPGWNSVQALNQYQQEIGGPLRGGDPGICLFEKKDDNSAWFTEIPPAFTPENDKLLALPRHQIFGTEELSNQSSSVAERIPIPAIGLNPQEAAKRKLKEGSTVTITANNNEHKLSLTITPELPIGTAALPTNIVEANTLIGVRLGEEESASSNKQSADFRSTPK